MHDLSDDHTRILPDDAERATLIGRVQAQEGPCVVAVRGGTVVDVTSTFPTMTDLLESRDPVAAARDAPGTRSWPIREILANSLDEADTLPRLLAPVDLSVLKAAGVTFATSLLERLIEERAGGNPEQANTLRAELEQLIGTDLSAIRPGSDAAAQLKSDLQER